MSQVNVPALEGLTEDDAITALEDVGLAVALPIIREYNKDVPDGQVISSDPISGAEVPEGTKVTVVISRGTELAKVPDTVGKKQADAETTIKAAGFKVKVTQEFSETVPSGTVISQSPDAGVSVDAGSTITIVVSKGPNSVIVPDVTSMMEADATAELTKLGLKVTVVYEISPDVGIVINQDPLPDTKVTKGSTVAIKVGKAP